VSGLSAILAINTGSSSVKVALFAGGRQVVSASEELAAHADSAAAIDGALDGLGADTQIDAVGHRIVHGGQAYREPRVITDALLGALRDLVPLDPDHLPQALDAIEAVRRRRPEVPQVACFDTAFHRTMPERAQRYALPRRMWDDGIRRYGFHGLSFEYVLGELAAVDPQAAGGKVVLAHLGSGASMAAVESGSCIDTTMGFTPTGGLVMSTRSGDLDPGLLLHLAGRGLGADELRSLVNVEAGLLGVSGRSGDMRDLLELEDSDDRAALAIEIFCYQARKWLGALAAGLGGIDAVVFTGGIGERSPAIRKRICTGLAFLGLELDPVRNAAHAAVVSSDASRVVAHVIPTNEELTIARHTRAILEVSTR
jgi:acetate kinase